MEHGVFACLTTPWRDPLGRWCFFWKALGWRAPSGVPLLASARLGWGAVLHPKVPTEHGAQFISSRAQVLARVEEHVETMAAPRALLDDMAFYPYSVARLLVLVTRQDHCDGSCGRTLQVAFACVRRLGGEQTVEGVHGRCRDTQGTRRSSPQSLNRIFETCQARGHPGTAVCNASPFEFA